jgi:hypothetical protein
MITFFKNTLISHHNTCFSNRNKCSAVARWNSSGSAFSRDAILRVCHFGLVNIVHLASQKLLQLRVFTWKYDISWMFMCWQLFSECSWNRLIALQLTSHASLKIHKTVFSVWFSSSLHTNKWKKLSCNKQIIDLLSPTISTWFFWCPRLFNNR